jgi:hypothetical protein
MPELINHAIQPLRFPADPLCVAPRVRGCPYPGGWDVACYETSFASGSVPGWTTTSPGALGSVKRADGHVYQPARCSLDHGTLSEKTDLYELHVRDRENRKRS